MGILARDPAAWSPDGSRLVFVSTSPVLVTGHPIIVDAVLEALDRLLRGPERPRELRLAREVDDEPELHTM